MTIRGVFMVTIRGVFMVTIRVCSGDDKGAFRVTIRVYLWHNKKALYEEDNKIFSE